MSIFDQEPALRRNDTNRTVKMTWEVGDTTDHYDKPCKAVTQLFVSHNKDRKRFDASLRRLNVADGNVEMFMVFGGTSLYLTSQRCARYSAAGLTAAAAAALAEMRALDADVLAKFADPASPA